MNINNQSTPAGQVQAGFCRQEPSNQTAVDIFQGLWKSQFPEESNVKAGSSATFEDTRVSWTADKLGGLAGKSVLELGPFEAYNTWQFSTLSASPIVAVEGSVVNYLKCLIVKEILNVRARFLHGDIIRFLQATKERFDLCWAAGVLYHQQEPLTLLKEIAAVSENLFLWTHFYDQDTLEDQSKYPHFDYERHRSVELDGFRCTHYFRSYRHGENRPRFFSGGSEEYAYWLSKNDILKYLSHLGFSEIVVRGINMHHPAGPTMSLLARIEE